MPDALAHRRLPIANVYIDGFNLYHGCFGDKSGDRRTWRNYKWLNVADFIASFVPTYSINRIRFFTAIVSPRPSNPDCQSNQLTYIRALETLPNLSVHLGRFAVNAKLRLEADPKAKPPTPLIPERRHRVIELEEKGSDVNLASYLLFDGFRQEYEWAIVVSNDSDLAEPIRLIHDEMGLRVLIINPRKKVAFDLRGIADSYKSIRVGALVRSQFPNTMSDIYGTITKPAEWSIPVA